MDDKNHIYEQKKYEPVSLPLIRPPAAAPAKSAPVVKPDETAFIDIKIPGVYKGFQHFNEITGKDLENSDNWDKHRELFAQMRLIAREEAHNYIDHSRLFYMREDRASLAGIFYKQGKLMEWHEDDYEKITPFSLYYPVYHRMDYSQCRTYFTWRTKVRKGFVTQTSLSYVYIYIYELINQIGVSDACDGLMQLTKLWTEYRRFDASIDKHMAKWVKDYHVYYLLSHTFGDYLIENDLCGFYPDVYVNQEGSEDGFTMFSLVSGYEVKSSVFYTDGNKQLVEGAINRVFGKIKGECAHRSLLFETLLFKKPTKKNIWHPFDGALFFLFDGRPDRKVCLNINESYYSDKDIWHKATKADYNKAFISYVFKQTESILRGLANHRQKLNASISNIDYRTKEQLYLSEINLEKIITEAVSEFFYEFNRVSVNVDDISLERIRKEAMDIKDKLTVEDAIAPAYVTAMREAANTEPSKKEPANIEPAYTVPVKSEFENTEPVGSGFFGHANNEKNSTGDIFDLFFTSLDELELKAICIALDNGDIRPFADKNGIMAEVLADAINQKAQDSIGDNILEYDGLFNVYTEYADELRSRVYNNEI